jgi:hypothetical protein
MQKNIRIFVNNKLIEIHKYSSIYSLKSKIATSLFEDAEPGDISLSYNSKPLKNNKTLYSYKIENDSNITASLSVNGGRNITYVFYILYFLTFVMYLLFIGSGLAPLFAHIFINSVIEFLGISNQGFMKIIFFLFSILSVPLFIWATSSYMIYPLYYYRTNNSCKATIAAKNTGYWASLMFAITYTLFTFPDTIIDILNGIFSNIPVIGALVILVLKIIKSGWNSIKFIPIYIMTFGSAMYLFRFIDAGVFVFYSVMQVMGLFNCEQNNLEELCQVFSELYHGFFLLKDLAVDETKKQDYAKKVKEIKEINKKKKKIKNRYLEKKVNEKGKEEKKIKGSPSLQLLRELRSLHKKYKIPYDSCYLEQKKRPILDEIKAALIAMVLEEVPLIGSSMDFLLKTLSNGFCLKAGKEPTSIQCDREIGILEEAFATSFCLFIGIFRKTYVTLNKVGTREDITNMIKSGILSSSTWFMAYFFYIIYQMFVL